MKDLKEAEPYSDFIKKENMKDLLITAVIAIVGFISTWLAGESLTSEDFSILLAAITIIVMVVLSWFYRRSSKKKDVKLESLHKEISLLKQEFSDMNFKFKHAVDTMTVELEKKQQELEMCIIKCNALTQMNNDLMHEQDIRTRELEQKLRSCLDIE